MSPAPTATVTEAEVEATMRILPSNVTARFARRALEAAAAVRPQPDELETLRRAFALSDATLRARAEKAEANAAGWARTAERICARALAAEAQVSDLTRRLDEVRGVLRDCEWCIEDSRSDTICHVCKGVNKHMPACRLAAAIAPETVKEAKE